MSGKQISEKSGIELALTPDYESEGLSITRKIVTAVLDLSEGDHTWQSESIPVGNYNGFDVHASLMFTYHYDASEEKVTLRGNDDKTEGQLRITTTLGGEDSLAFHHSPNEIAANVAANHLWSDYVARNEDFSNAMKETARECNTILVTELVDQQNLSVLERGTAPIVTLENLNDFKRMFGEPVPQEDVGVSPAADLARMQTMVYSTYVGTVTWPAKKNFANVKGSTQDPLVPGYTSWLDLWRDKCNGGANTTKCSSYNWYSKDTTWTCNSTFVGGHVIPGTTAKSMPKGSTVYIFPICSRHNGSDPNYMEMLYNPVGVQLNYYK